MIPAAHDKTSDHAAQGHRPGIAAGAVGYRNGNIIEGCAVHILVIVKVFENAVDHEVQITAVLPEKPGNIGDRIGQGKLEINRVGFYLPSCPPPQTFILPAIPLSAE